MIIMGLFRKIAIDAANTAMEVLSEKVPEASGHIEKLKIQEYEFDGKEKHTVYTYNGSPLSGLRKGRTFYSTVVVDPAVVGRLLYGKKLDEDDNSIALAYKGKAYGTFGSFNSIFHEMISKGYTIRVRTKIIGMYDVGIPEVVAYMPDRDEVDLWRDACNGLGREIPFNERNTDESIEAAEEYGERVRLEWAAGHELPRGTVGFVFNFDEWPGKRSIKKAAQVNISMEWLEPKEGSLAKPHILIKEGDTVIKELSARSRQYNNLSKYVGIMPSESICRKLDSIKYEGTYYWKLSILYFDDATRLAIRQQ